METFMHQSVLLEEAIEGLNVKPDGIYIDCTLGGAGHSKEILKRLKTGFLYGFDQDKTAIETSYQRLKEISDRFELINRNFVYLQDEMLKRNVTGVDGILFDLGVSSPQFDQGERGFSYKYDAKLDMRMNQDQTLTAYDIVNNYRFEDLVYIISKYGEERYAKQIARAIERERKKKPIETTLELVEVIKSAVPLKNQREKHPAKRTFQALRIETNKELEVLPQALEQAIKLLKPGGRLCVITFHSLEDKITKDIFKKYSDLPELPRGLPVLPDNLGKPILKIVNKKVITPSEEELAMNKRAHSAKLRIVEKV
ncbi:MAG: 16S rRNA (cytosine(1402)-N(4))-methyltransferase RsmH [Bacilli bacterium]|nr:16S rRNA (cytosine(1402)-N(4))-methyltransferase RsmH [Bacilli bacterium]